MSNNHTAEIRRAMISKGTALGIPVSGVFELTPRCNLSCKMCYIRMTPEEMKAIGEELSAEQWLSLAEAAVKEGLLFLLITGGEPLIRKDFKEIYEGLMRLGLSISINTNGTLIDNSIKELWHRLPPAYVNITLYGLNEQDYEDFCGDGKAFYRVREALYWLKENKILVNLNATITPDNKEQLEDFYAFAKEYGAELRAVSYCFPPLRRLASCSNTCFSRLSPEEAAEIAIRNIQIREGTEGILRRLRDIDRISPRECELEASEHISCTAGKTQFWAAWNGTVTPCGMMTKPSADLRQGSFSEIWRQIKAETAKITLSRDCSDCPEKATCTNCAATALTETGRFDGTPEYLCKMNNSYRKLLSSLTNNR